MYIFIKVKLLNYLIIGITYAGESLSYILFFMILFQLISTYTYII